MTAPSPTKPPRGSLSAGQQVTFGPLATERGIIIVAFLVILAAGILLTATPRMVNQVRVEGLESTLQDAVAFDRNMEATATARIDAGDEPFAWVRTFGQQFRAEMMSPFLQQSFPDSAFMVETPEMTINSRFPSPAEAIPQWLADEFPIPTSFGTFLKLRYLEGIENQTTLSEGRLPEPRASEVVWGGNDCPDPLPTNPDQVSQDDLFDEDGNQVCFYAELPVYEVLFSSQAMDVLNLETGSRMVVRRPNPLLVEVVGIVESNNPDDDYWFGDNQIDRPGLNMVYTPNGYVIEDAFPVGVFAPGVYRDLLGELSDDFVYRFRYFLDQNRVTPDNAGDMSAEIRQLQLSRFVPPYDTVRFASGVPQLIDNYFAQMSRVVGSLSTALFGVAISTLALVGILAYMIESRQHTALVLVRNRGGSRIQLTMSQIFQALVVAVPAIALAYLTALLITAYDSDLSTTLALLIVVAVPVMFVAAAYPTTHADLGVLQRSSDSSAPGGQRRRVAEFMVIVLSAMAVLLVLRRGSASGGVDVTEAAVPTLLAIAGGLIASRLISLPVGAAAWLATKGTGITNFVGFRRVRQQAPKARAPMLVIVITVALAVFTYSVRTSVLAADEVASYGVVGADFRVTGSFEGQRLPVDLDFSDVNGVTAQARGMFSRASLACMADRTSCDLIDVLVVEGPAYHEVITGTAADPGLPPFLVNPQTGGEAGTEDNPIRAVVSSAWQSSGFPTVGRVFSLRLLGSQIWFSIAEVRDSFPGLDPRRPFVVVDSSQVESSGAEVDFNSTTVFLRGGASATDSIEAGMVEWNPNAQLESRHEMLDEVRTSLIARTVSLGLLAAFGVLALFAALATVSFVVLTDRARLRDLGYLRTIGLGAGQARRIAGIEVATTASVAALAGALLAVTALHLLSDIIGLEVIAGAGIPTVVTVTIAVTLLAFIVAVPGSGRSRDLTRILKMGDE